VRPIPEECRGTEIGSGAANSLYGGITQCSHWLLACSTSCRAGARAVGLGDWDPVLLYEPDVNLRLGTRHLAAETRRYQRLEHVLAAYNAGGSRVERWLRTPGVDDDAELFVERIPYVETRDYVRRVLVNLERYRALYAVPDSGVGARSR